MPDDDDRRFRIRLPPIKLPPLRLPEGFEPVVPVAERVRGSGSALLAAIALDLIDAAVVASVGGGLPRVALGTLLAAAVVGPAGLGYAWEALPALAGRPLLAVAPTATLLALLRRLG